MASQLDLPTKTRRVKRTQSASPPPVKGDIPHKGIILTFLELQSHFGDKPLKFQVISPHNGTAVIKGLTLHLTILPIHMETPYTNHQRDHQPANQTIILVPASQ